MKAGFNPFPADVRADPYPVYRRLREDDPVHWSEVIQSWVLTRYEDVVLFFHDPRLSADRTRADKYRGARRAAPTTFQVDPPDHTRMRALVNEAFTPRVVAELRPRVAALTEQLLDRAADNREVDIIADFAYPLPITIIADMLGAPKDDRDRFRRWGHAFALSVDHTYAERPAEDITQELTQYFAEIVARRTREPRDDLISRFLAAEQNGDRLTEAEVVQLCVTLLFAGHETTVNLIGNGLAALLRFPDQLVLLREKNGMARAAVEELLRFDSPAQIISRTAAEDLELDGKEIRKGQTLVGLLGAANRDPAVFREPDALDLGRTPNPHLAFGYGIHFCLGAQLSRLEAQIALPAFVRRFPALSLGAETLAWRETAVLRGLRTLPVTLR